ncbi:MAG TPA: BamA/TamA family outer membrane protein, partial [Pirellulales bacterium]|nr:BamA/TamA family outer membrane protein [Pirellulales bacterium]
PGAAQAGQVPLRRTGPDAPAGFGSSRYPSAGYGGVAGQPVQYAPPAGPSPTNGGAYGQPGSVTGTYGAGVQNPPPQLGYQPGTVGQPGPVGQPGQFAPSGQYGAPPQPGPNRPAPFFQPGPQAGPGALGPQGAPPSVYPSPNSIPGYGAQPNGPMIGGGPPPLGGYGSQGEMFSPDSPFNEPPLPVPITVQVQETQTGRLMFGVGVNSNAGLIGNIVVDEQNFDWRRIPTSWEDIRNATAFRGAGQQFRIEAYPGTLLSRYGFTFREPYLWDTRINFGLDGYYFNRYYQNWTEERIGGRVSFGYMLTPDLSTSLGMRGEDVKIFNPTVPTPPELQRVLGNSALFVGSWNIVHDTRDSPFLPTQGHRLSLELEEGFGTFNFPRAVVGWRQHFLVYERPDGSGRQVINLLNDTGFTGANTPIYENFFAGGYNTIRGFYFRGASPLDMGVQVGGKFEFLNTVEYMFPITPADALRGVVFCDFGTVERSTELKWQDFRISPGFGLRVTIPAMGPAPIALDFAFPIHKAPGDQLQMFNFFVGVQR